MLLKLVDGAINNVRYDSESWGGCETCDYGSQYINKFSVDMESGTLDIDVSQMYDFVLSEGYLMKLFLQNASEIEAMTESVFRAWVETEVWEEVEREYSWRDKNVEIKWTPNE